jgi:L-2-hydroxycarboxylate dehydrogenase (NAD+)
VALAGGSLVPIAGYKGYGLALSLGLLTGVLADWRFDYEIVHPYHDHSAPGDTSGVFIALAVESFQSAEQFMSRTREIGDALRALPSAPGFDRVMLPGDKEHEREQEHEQDGVPVSETSCADLVALAKRFDLSIDPIFERATWA